MSARRAQIVAEGAGVVCLAAAGWWYSVLAGLVVTGLLLLLVGNAPVARTRR